MTDRAVSDLLGYIFIFSLVILSIAVVSTSGFGALEDARDGTVIQNVESSFLTLHDASGDVRDGEELRSVSMDLGPGQLRSSDETVTVEVEITGPSNSHVVTKQSTPLVYRYQSTRYVYAAGAVLRVREGSGAQVIAGPGMRINNDPSPSVAIVPVIKTTPVSGPYDVGGTNVRLTLTRAQQSTISQSSSSVTVRVTSPTRDRARAWESYLLDAGFDSCSLSVPGDFEMTCERSGFSGRVLVPSSNLEYEVSS